MPHSTLLKRFPAAQTLGLILSAAFAVCGQIPKPDEARELPPNQIIERQMTGAETHRYKITLKQNEFLQIRVEQKGIDVALKLIDVNDKTLATMDSPNDKQGAEILSFIAAISGEYILEASGFDEKAENGNYTIRREASRTATATDKKRVTVELLFIEAIAARNAKDQSETALAKFEEALSGWQELKDTYLAGLTTEQIKLLKNKPKKARAQALVDEGKSLFNQKTKESLQAALPKYDEARKLYQEADDTENQAFCLYKTGAIYANLGDNQKAEDFYKLALSVIRADGKKSDEAYILIAIGIVYSNLNNSQKALEYDTLAVPLFKEIGDKNGEATALNDIGDLNYLLGDKQKALENYNLALPLFKSAGKKGDEALILTGIGDIYEDLGDKQKALEYYNSALPLFREDGNKAGEAEALNKIGDIYISFGENQKALENYSQALISYEKIADKSAVAITLNSIGIVYERLGETQKALEYYNQALQLFRELGNKIGEANLLTRIGEIYSDLGEQEKALEYFNQSLQISQSVGNKNSEALARVTIGMMYLDLGDKQKALESLNLALPLFRETNNKDNEALTLSDIGRVYSDSDEYIKALDYYNRASYLYNAIGNKIAQSYTLVNIATVYLNLGNKQKALEYYKPALTLFRGTGNKFGEGVVLNNIGGVYRDLGEHQKSIEYFNPALVIFKAVGHRRGEAVALSNISSAWNRLGNRRLAILYGKQSVNAYQSLRANIKGLDKNLQQSFLERVESVYRNLAELLIKDGRIPEAEQVLAMLKEKEYSEFVRGGDLTSGLDKRINLSPSEKDALERYDKIADQLTQLGSDYAKLEAEKNQPNVTPEKAKAILAQEDAINEKLTLARTTLDKFLEVLKQEFSREDKRIASVEEGLQAEVKSWNDPHVVVISTIVGKDNLSVIVTTPEIQIPHIIQISEEELNDLIGNFRAKLTDPSSDPKPAAQKLYDKLIKPLEKDLDGTQAHTLVWSLDGNLRYVPMAALWDKDKGYLIQRYANVVITLASRGNLAQRPEGKAKWQALGVGVSKAVGGFNALSNVPEELNAIVSDPSVILKTKEKSVMNGRRLLDEQFTYDAFRTNLGRFPIVHAATHFSFISGVKDESLNSFLLLGNGEELTLAKIQNSGTIFNGVQLLTLSACDTAYGGKDADGREVEGFGALAQKKGAKAVIATLWRVADVSTRNLMIDFYGDYRKPNFSKAESLRQAQLLLLQEPDKAATVKAARTDNASSKKFAHPYYWSPFILIGNWQ